MEPLPEDRPVRMGQYGTKHSHSAGVLGVMLASPDVEVVGVYEPDPLRRRELEDSGSPPWSQVTWVDDVSELLEDPTIPAISSEGSNAESLDQTEEIVDAGKHVFYDKPAGENYAQFERVVARSRERGLLVQLGYMFRYHDGFSRIAEWARAGYLGDVYGVRAHMSTSTLSAVAMENFGHRFGESEEYSPGRRVDVAQMMDREDLNMLALHQGGIFYDLAAHMLDQIVWILGRPGKVTSFLRQDNSPTLGFVDNSLSVLEYDRAMAYVDIAAMEPSPAARRFEVYGSAGSAIMEPFEPADTLRLCLRETRGEYPSGVSVIKLEKRPRYVASLKAFIKDLRGQKQPDRSLDHELLVQETLLRATGALE